ncbi:MAG: GntR family transcriptional regulator, partial [Acidobacteriota bacterium]
MFEIISVSKGIYDYISNAINEGLLKPGEKIDERAICLELKVSRTPVREALAELAGEGYLERTSRRGFRVKSISAENAKEIYEIIGNLEGLAARKALPRLQPQDFADMEALLARMDGAIRERNISAFYKLQRTFHDVFVRACGSQTLIEILESLKNRFMRQVY